MVLVVVGIPLKSWRSSILRGMPIASNPLPPHLRVLRSVGQAAGPQMVLRHDNNTEPKRGAGHVHTHGCFWRGRDKC